MGLFNALPNFLFTTSETNGTINSKQGICELHHKLPNDLWLRNLGQIRKISLELWTIAQSYYQNEIFFNTSQKLLKNKNWTIPTGCYFT